MSASLIIDESKKRSKIQQSTCGPFYITEFKSLFEKYCTENGCLPCPVVREEQYVVKGSKSDVPQLLISYRGTNREELDKISYKHFPIRTGIMVALQKLLINITVSILKLEFCNMTSEHVEILSKMLSRNNSIMEVSLNGNPNREQNFHLLLQETQLMNLSLRFCGINQIGIEKISKALSTPFDSYLLHLNLSSNSIGDEGAYYIMQFLRINRTLMSLNLADNKIYDEGCLTLVQPLQKFRLTLEEIIVKRRIRFSLLRQGEKVTKTVSITDGSQTSNKTGPNSIKSSKEKIDNYSEHSSIGSKKSSSVRSDTKRDIGNHPFVQDSYEEDKEIYCIGNNTLLNLNLSYNRITKEGLTAIVQMMNTQNITFAHDKGISRISVEGNDFNNNCEQELQELEELLIKKLGLFSSTSTSLSSKNKSQSSIGRRRRSSRHSLGQ